jgi:N-acyl-D-amino-acid deacylase
MDWENFAGILGWDKILVSSVASEANHPLEGLSIPQIAEARGLQDPVDAACDLLIEEELAVGMISFGLSEEDVVTIMQHPAVSVITDSLLGGGKPHPRTYGTYPRILGRYVRDQQILRLEEAIRKMTSLPAQNLRLRTKGLLAAGYDADIVVFDPHTIRETATYEDPRKFPIGIHWVLVNGVPAVARGELTGERPGRTIRNR